MRNEQDLSETGRAVQGVGVAGARRTESSRRGLPGKGPCVRGARAEPTGASTLPAVRPETTPSARRVPRTL